MDGTALSLPNGHYVTPVTNLANTVYAIKALKTTARHLDYL